MTSEKKDYPVPRTCGLILVRHYEDSIFRWQEWLCVHARVDRGFRYFATKREAVAYCREVFATTDRTIWESNDLQYVTETLGRALGMIPEKTERGRR